MTRGTFLGMTQTNPWSQRIKHKLFCSRIFIGYFEPQYEKEFHAHKKRKHAGYFRQLQFEGKSYIEIHFRIGPIFLSLAWMRDESLHKNFMGYQQKANMTKGHWSLLNELHLNWSSTNNFRLSWQHINISKSMLYNFCQIIWYLVFKSELPVKCRT